MNKLNKTLLLISAAMLLACDGKESAGPEPTPARDKVPLQIVSGIGSTTRAFDSSWEANDAIGVFTTVAGSGSGDANPFVYTKSGSSYDANIAYKITTDEQTLDGSTHTHVYKSFLPSTEGKLIYLPADGSDVDVYAYYPYSAAVWPENATAPSPLDITIPASQTLENQKTTDVLKAKALSSTSTIDIDHTTAQLLFSHVLSKVIVKVKAGTGYNATDLSDRTVVKFAGQPVSATFAPITQALTITDTDANENVVAYQLQSGDPDFSSETGVIHTYRALLLPNDETNLSTKPTRKIVFTVGTAPNTITYYYDLSNSNNPTSGSPIVFASGQVTTFTITLQATGVSITAAITDWTEVTSVPETPLYE